MCKTFSRRLRKSETIMKTITWLLISILIGAVACQAAPTPLPAPTATHVPPTATPIPSTVTPLATLTPLPTVTSTRVTATPTIAPAQPTKDARNFAILETAHALIAAQPGVSIGRAQEVGQTFELAYQIVGENLAYPAQPVRLYVYQTEDDLLNDLVATWRYPEWFRVYRAYPRMSNDWVAWIPPLPRGDGAFIAHEYTHRVIEQIAGVGSQFNFKWFDEGLAEYLGLQVLARVSARDAQNRRAEQRARVSTSYKQGALIALDNLTTEAQFARAIERDARLAYAQAGLALDYLITQRGIVSVKQTLGLIGQGRSFADAFRQAYGFGVNDFEKEFFAYAAQLSDAPSGSCFNLDGRADDWQKLKPLIVDDAYPPIARGADVRAVSAVTCQGALYLMIQVDAPAQINAEITFAFEVDLDDDGKAEYQLGFDQTRAWLWNLKGTGYADMQKNMITLSNREFKIAMADVIEFMLPVALIENSVAPRIRVYTFVRNQLANRHTVWGQVQSWEGQ